MAFKFTQEQIKQYEAAQLLAAGSLAVNPLATVNKSDIGPVNPNLGVTASQIPVAGSNVIGPVIAPVKERVLDRLTVKGSNGKDKTKEIAPVFLTAPLLVEPHYQKHYDLSGIDMSKYVTQHILGVETQNSDVRKFLDPSPQVPIEAIKNKMDNAKDYGEKLKYTQEYNVKMMAYYSDVFRSTKMDGQDHSVLDEIEMLAKMEPGEEKEKRKEAVLTKMEELGMDKTFYSHFAGDGSFDWNTFGNWLKNAAMAGLESVNSGIANTADVLLGTPLKAMGWEDNPISKLADQRNDLMSSYQYNKAMYAEKLGAGSGMNFAGEAVTGLVGAVPNAILAWLTGGVSAASTPLATQAAYNTGNVLTQAGLTAEAMAKNPQFWSSFAQTLGNDYKQAKEKGVGDNAAAIGAVLNSLLNAGVEIGVDGASGIQGLPQDIAKGGSKFWSWIESAIEEGGEEGLQKFISESINRFIYGSDEEMLQPREYAKDMAIGTISGLALGGGQIATQTAVNAANDAILKNTLSQNEKTVVDHLVRERMAEATENGEKTSRSDIRKRVIAEMEKGYIPTDKIEEILGGDSYKAYKDAADKQDALKKELDELRRMKKGDMNDIQMDRLAELKGMNLDDTENRDSLKATLRSEVSELVKGDRLAESYAEHGRRNNAFEADLTQYDEKVRGTYQRAMESGVLNNTNRSHELVDFVAKVEADKGVKFDFTNNQKLKDSGFGVKGASVNGYVTADGVVLNVNSSKYLQSVAGHEITHVLEGTEFYDAMKEAVFNYAKIKGEYDSRLDTLTKLYENVKGADIEVELTADLVGDYIFSDTDFIKNLSTENRNLFKKIYDEIKYLCKTVTAGSKEARQLEKVKKLFAEAYRQDVKNTAEDGGVKYSLMAFEKDGRRFVEVDQNQDLFAGHSVDEYPAIAKDIIKEKFENKVVGIDNKMFVNGAGRSEYAYPSKPITDDDVYAAKMRAAPELDNLLDAGTNFRNVNDGKDGHVHPDAIGGFDYYDTLFKIGNRYFEGRVNIKNIKRGKLFKDVTQIKDVTQAIMNSYGHDPKFQFLRTSSMNSISQIPEKSIETGKKADLSLSSAYAKPFNNGVALEDIAPIAESQRNQIGSDDIAPLPRTARRGIADDIGPVKSSANDNGNKPVTRKELHSGIIDSVKTAFKAKGFDFDKVLKEAKNLHTWATVDNTPQRVMEKTFGYKEGGILADITVNKVAQDESEGIRWVNKNVKTLKDISKQYHIKPGSKESAAAQMYAEGFFVNENNEIVRYGDPELIQDFKDPEVRRNIKALAGDPRIRKIYDDTLASINAARARNLYPEIPRLDNYFLHFRAMNDTFSTLGLPFNPNDIRAKDLPTDLNGVTADLKPGQPFFASAMHRKGKRTSFDMLGGIERYLNSAKDQIYHIDNIQTLRALRNYIAETYGQATGLENIDSMTDAEAEERIEQVYGSHLSTFAKFLNEEANVLAGKTALIDRGLEGIIGRRGITFLNALNGQVGSNMVGYNISSSLTNFLPVAQAFAKTNKFDFVKAFAQTAANKISGGRFDSFAEDSPVVIRRKGTDRFYQTPWQKMQNPGYVLMGAVDDISTELIARTKYNEFTRKGMDSQKAHFETDKWVSRLMGDRSLGQQPQLFNSKMLGLVTKFQLEVRNQLDAQFYDTIQETKASNEKIENGLLRNAKTAAQATSTLVQLAVFQHLFGKAFESVAGYNPAFDIIEVLMTAFGHDDDEESEDTVLDNLGQALMELAEDMPYASILLDGGRVPVSEAIPNISNVLEGKDEYGNEVGMGKAFLEEAKDVAPYYLMPGGYGQLKKTVAGLEMYDLSEDHPIAGSYTNSGNLRFPVDIGPVNIAQAAVFGQYANENARQYFDEEQQTLNPEQTKIFAAMGIPIQDYWEYRDKYNDFKEFRNQLWETASTEEATAEDVVKNQYVNSIYYELNDLYDLQKELADSSLTDRQSQMREIQDQMNHLLETVEAVNDASVDGIYAEVGDRRYNYSKEKDTWYEIKPKNADGEDNWYYTQEKLFHDKLGISPADYWNGRYSPDSVKNVYAEMNGKRYNFSTENKQWHEITGSYLESEQNAIKRYNTTPEHYWNNRELYKQANEYFKYNWDLQTVAKNVFKNGSFVNYAAELSQIKGEDLDGDGKSDSGTKKKKVFAYIDTLDAPDVWKKILRKMSYPSEDTYNMEIIEYMNKRRDLSYADKKETLVALGFAVDSNGNITWK